MTLEKCMFPRMKKLFYQANRCIFTAKIINQSIDLSNKLEKEFFPIQTTSSNPIPHPTTTTTTTPLREATTFKFNVLLKLDLSVLREST